MPGRTTTTFYTEGCSLATCQQFPCPQGYGCQYVNASLQCSRCPGSLYSPEGLECKPCLAGTQPAPNSTICVACPAGKHSLLGMCTDCPQGKIPDETTLIPRVTCTTCPPNQVPNSDSTGCECEAERYNISHGPILCYDHGYQDPETWFLRDEYIVARVDLVEGSQCAPCPPCATCAGGENITVAAGYRPGVATGEADYADLRMDAWTDATNRSSEKWDMGNMGEPRASKNLVPVARARVLFKCPGATSNSVTRCPGSRWDPRTNKSSIEMRCGEGNKGPLCGACEEGYFSQSKGLPCKSCVCKHTHDAL